jgi:hypothetical protein
MGGGDGIAATRVHEGETGDRRRRLFFSSWFLPDAREIPS